MNRFFIFILFQLLFAEIALAQVSTDSSASQLADTVLRKDSDGINNSRRHINNYDSVSLKSNADSGWKIAPGISLQQQNQQISQKHPYSGFNIAPNKTNFLGNIKKSEGKESLFYVLTGLFLFYAFLRRSFPKYFKDLFRLFFRTTIKQRQIREQLMQTPLPSLLMNSFFVISSSLYVNLLIFHFELKTADNFWIWFLYCILGISGIYFIKYLGLKLTGWVLNMAEAANSYIFIVFVVNKVIGVFLLPFLVLLAFLQGSGYDIALIVSLLGIGILLLYRLILTYSAVRNQVKVNPFHFFLYFCAFELAPLLLIYKALLVFFK